MFRSVSHPASRSAVPHSSHTPTGQRAREGVCSMALWSMYDPQLTPPPRLNPRSPNCLISSFPQGILSRAQSPAVCPWLYSALLLVDLLFFCSLCSWGLKLTSHRLLHREGDHCEKWEKGLFACRPHTGSCGIITKWQEDPPFPCYFLQYAAWHLQVSFSHCLATCGANRFIRYTRLLFHCIHTNN